MKFQVTMKCPDALDYAIKRAAQDDDEERHAHFAARKWFRYGEPVTVEIDTDTGTAKVLEI